MKRNACQCPICTNSTPREGVFKCTEEPSDPVWLVYFNGSNKGPSFTEYAAQSHLIALRNRWPMLAVREEAKTC